jgi:hypothetical protein
MDMVRIPLPCTWTALPRAATGAAHSGATGAAHSGATGAAHSGACATCSTLPCVQLVHVDWCRSRSHLRVNWWHSIASFRWRQRSGDSLELRRWLRRWLRLHRCCVQLRLSLLNMPTTPRGFLTAVDSVDCMACPHEGGVAPGAGCVPCQVLNLHVSAQVAVGSQRGRSIRCAISQNLGAARSAWASITFRSQNLLRARASFSHLDAVALIDGAQLVDSRQQAVASVADEVANAKDRPVMFAFFVVQLDTRPYSRTRTSLAKEAHRPNTVPGRGTEPHDTSRWVTAVLGLPRGFY